MKLDLYFKKFILGKDECGMSLSKYDETCLKI
jgi:hypothetical protein